MNYIEALDFIHSVLKFGSKLGLVNITELMRRLGNPQDSIKTIHVAGTNGKGSTASMLANILQCQGYKTGLFISPYIEDFCERMQINSENIPILLLPPPTQAIIALGKSFSNSKICFLASFPITF